MHQHLARSLQPQLPVEAGRGAPQHLVEPALEVAQGETRDLAQPRQRQRLLQVTLHGRNDGEEPGVIDPGPELQGHALRIPRAPYAMLNELVGRVPGEVAAVLLLDQIEHHIEGRRAAGTGHAVPIDLKQPGRQAEMWKLAGEVLEFLPMQGTAIALEQARARQRIGARADAAQNGIVAREPAQPGEDPPVAVVAAANPGAEEHDRQPVDVRHRGMRLHGDAAAGAHGLAILGQEHPVVERLPAHPVGDAQRLDRCREGQHRKVRCQEKSDLERDAGSRFRHAIVHPLNFLGAYSQIYGVTRPNSRNFVNLDCMRKSTEVVGR